MRNILALSLALIGLAGPALAHATEQGIVMLLPTGYYIAGGVASVILTVLLVSVLPDRAALALFKPLPLLRSRGAGASVRISSASFAALVLLVVAGWFGPHDPTRNPLPLAIWSLFWVALVVLQGLFGDLWRWLNPWSGPYWLLRRRLTLRPYLRYPRWLGHWPALASFLAFAAVLLAHPAPGDPDQLAPMVASYWLFHFLGMLVFGPKWRRRAEGISVLMANYASVAIFAKRGGRWRAGLPGWRFLTQRRPPVALATFMIVMLAVGSFDGLNETFWWLGLIGVNPLEFPGRSFVVDQNLIGLAVACTVLVAGFVATVYLGTRLAGAPRRFGEAFRRLAPAILPIALGYHFAHYMPSFLVEIQYVLRLLNDPLNLGWSLLGLKDFYVTTGFFNTTATMRTIWLGQAGGVVIGHVLAILSSHALAVQMFGTHSKATRSQLALATFMVLYTLFGLWLLASPRGA
ncbi:hypothetical protein [Acidimangrovimonas pyrenivorans]|uniref:Fenitrothion hydrolase n=1 Tax=Acidimangrovimonas pyrenivorans TaxID=2030798 RepID=A0ABV7ACN7_9RHOB